MRLLIGAWKGALSLSGSVYAVCQAVKLPGSCGSSSLSTLIPGQKVTNLMLDVMLFQMLFHPTLCRTPDQTKKHRKNCEKLP